MGLSCVVPRIICRGRRSVSDGACRVGPGIIRRGAKECVGLDWLRRPQNDLLGAKSVSDGAGCINPRIIRRGTGLVASVWGGGFVVCGSLAEG